MHPSFFLTSTLQPGLAVLEELGGPISSIAAERVLLAIALQESDATHRYQGAPGDTAGPAKGFWQFEVIAVQEMLTNSLTTVLANKSCERYSVAKNRNAVHRAIEGHDGLAVALARLLLWTHPDPLPHTEERAWGQYLSLWRPGRPRGERWAGCWQAAHQATLVAGGGNADTRTAGTE